MPIDPSISLGVKPLQLPNSLQMALQGQELKNQALQGQQLQLSTAANLASGNAIQQATDPTSGQVDTNKVQALIGQDPNAAYNLQQTTGQNLVQQGQQTQNTSTQLAQHKAMLDYAVQQLSPLMNKPDLSHDDIANEMNSFGQKFNVPPPVLAQGLSQLPPTGASPEALKSFIRQRLISNLNQQEQLAAITPQVSMVPTIGANGQPVNQPTNINPNAGSIAPIPGSTAQPMTMVPGNLETIETDALNNKHIVSRSASGAILSTRPMPGATGPQNPNPGNPGFVQLTAGQGADITGAQQEVAGIRSVGDQVPLQHNINQKIINLSKDTTSGPGTPAWQNALAGLSLGQFGDNYQLLGKYLERNAIMGMQAMGGPPSDGRLAASEKANGTPTFNPGALQDLSKFSDAVSTGVGMFRQGMDKAVGLQNADYTALPTFKSAWANNMDVNLFQLINAQKSGDRSEIDKISKELGPKGMQSLAQKYLNIQALSQTGRLPSGQGQ